MLVADADRGVSRVSASSSFSLRLRCGTRVKPSLSVSCVCLTCPGGLLSDSFLSRCGVFRFEAVDIGETFSVRHAADSMSPWYSSSESSDSFSGCPIATSNCVSWFSLGAGISVVDVNEEARAMDVSVVSRRDAGVVIGGTLVGVRTISVIMSCTCGLAVSGGADMSRIPVSV